jgi:5-formyltetrahydrofolate cyclo-ligase
MTAEPPGAKARIRRDILALRAGLSRDGQQAAAAQVASRAWHLPALARAQRIALYVPIGSELDCTPIVTGAWRRGRSVYLPVVTGKSLVFAPFEPDTLLAENRLRIPEPVVSPRHWKRARELQVVLAPLVAFDAAGCRLGMGGGFYDRTLHFLATRRFARRPHFIGLGYDFQRVASLPADCWDVHLDWIITDSATYRRS